MNNHHFAFSLILFFTNLYLTSSTECATHTKYDDIPFNIKVQQTPLILIGTSLKKDFDIDVPNLFNISFLVRCILKGPPTQRYIHIVQAG